MPRQKKQRIATEAAAELQTSPFAALEIRGRESESCGTDVPPAAVEPNSRIRERLLLRRSTAHRGGKTVLVLEGFSPAWTDEKLHTLHHDLKKSLGCGGKVGDRALELQGELADRLILLLESRGFIVKRGW